MARDRGAYWRANLRALSVLLVVWAVAGFGLGIVAVPWLDRVHVAGFPLGFWFAQQGSILVFVVLIFVYARWMDRLERRLRPGAAQASPGNEAQAPAEDGAEAPPG